jgi:conjugative transfer region protein TrbK
MIKISRLLACLVLVVATFSSAALVAQQSGAQSTAAGSVTNPLAKELERCKALNEKAASDEGCEAAYRESRKQFLVPPQDYQPSKVDMFPKTQNQPWTTNTKPAAPSPGD